MGEFAGVIDAIAPVESYIRGDSKASQCGAESMKGNGKLEFHSDKVLRRWLVFWCR
jgi:hypothetical protein